MIHASAALRLTGYTTEGALLRETAFTGQVAKTASGLALVGQAQGHMD